MATDISSPTDWVRDQVELYERSGGMENTTVRNTGLPGIIVTDAAERARRWNIAVAAYSRFDDHEAQTTRQIPLFVAEPIP